jgi:CRISP-associated protein Cas1
MAVHARPQLPLDGIALFHEAVSIAGLTAGWERVWRNQGAAGGDGMSVTAFAVGAAERIAALAMALREGSYRAGPLREASIPKDAGGTRKLSIPCVRDRVAQSAVAQVLMRRLDPHMEDASFGYRVGRSVADAVKRVEQLRKLGYVWTLDADIDDFFATIPIDPLITILLRSVSESPLVELISTWLEQGATLGRGIAQGSPLSPLLANLYLDELDERMSTGGVRIVRYADDFVVLAKDRPAVEAARGRVEKLLGAHGLKLDAEKTRVRGYDETLRFLGYAFVRGWAMKSPDEPDHEQSDLVAALRRLGEQDAAAERAVAAEADAERAPVVPAVAARQAPSGPGPACARSGPARCARATPRGRPPCQPARALAPDQSSSRPRIRQPCGRDLRAVDTTRRGRRDGRASDGI